MKLTAFVVAPKALHELIIMPQFADVIDSESGSVTVPSDEEGDWMMMDDVTESGRPVLDLTGHQNILKRRDATCKLIYSPVGKLGARNIYGTKLYAATEDCQEEFYQGAFEDYEQGNFDIFGENVMPLLEKGVATDIYTNKYFGDVTRASDATGVWSWNKFNGIFTHIAKYIADGVISLDQTFAIAGGAISAANANTALQNAYDRQDDITDNLDDSEKCFYVNKKLADAYYSYLITSGQTNLIERQSGRPPKMYFKGIEVKAKKWDGVLKTLNGGTQAHAVILTVRGNFVYGANSKYGGGPKRNEAVRMWWSDDDNVWKRQIHLMSSTEIAAPQHIVLGITAF